MEAMIDDPTALDEIRQSWAGVEALREKLQASAFASGGVIGGTFPHALSDAAHNLPFVHAYGVLNDVLEQLAKEGNFICGSIFLGALMTKSERAIPWQDFALVKAGVDRRNEVAHKGVLLDRSECWEYVDAVSAELASWGIVSPDSA